MDRGTVMRPRVLIVGDLSAPYEIFRRGFEPLAERGFHIIGINWSLKNYEELTAINRAVEKQGPEAVEVPAEIREAIAAADILAVQFCPVTRRVMENAERLKVIGVMRAGAENVDLSAARRLGIGVLNVKGRNAQAVAEFALGLLLSETQNIARAHHGLCRRRLTKAWWNLNDPLQISNKVFGIVGLGEVGRRFARLLRGFDMGKILVHDPEVSVEAVRSVGGEPATLEELCRESDFISVHARLNAETRRLISYRQIELMKPNCYIINTARAEIINEEAIVTALREGRIGGACLDVFEVEPLPPHNPFIRLENVTITPHLAGKTADSVERSASLLTEDFLRLLNGEKARNTLTRDVMDSIDWRHVFERS